MWASSPTAQEKYNSHGDILTSTDAYGKVTSYTYDNKRNVTSVTTPEGVKTNNVYDAYGNVLTSTVSNGSNIGAGNATTYTNYGTVVDKVTDPFGTVTKYDVNSTTFTTNAVYSDYTSNIDYLSKTEYNYYNTATVNGLGPLKSVAVKDKNGNTLSSVSYDYSQGELDYIRRGNNYYNFYFSYLYVGSSKSAVLSSCTVYKALPSASLRLTIKPVAWST